LEEDVMDSYGTNCGLAISRQAMATMVEEERRITATLGEPDWVANYFANHKDRLALDYEWCRWNISRQARILEVGAYPFFVTCALMSDGFAVQTVDHPAPQVTDLARRLEIDSAECDIERQPLPFPDDSFDEILFNEVFEHLRIDLLFTMDELRRVLRPGGRLWLSTPNVRSIRGIVNFLLRNEVWSRIGGGVFAQWNHLRTQGWMGHLREYTSKEVADFLRASGFTVDRVVYRGGWTSPAANVLSTMRPSLRPYFSCIASKTA
jgi:SAM-dependent methyltransferase